ncbi:MAG: hypothetical protein P8Z49_10770, partial [Acidobacteriota bacterium]
PAFVFDVEEEDLHYKFVESFLGGRRTSCLFRFVVVEGRLTQHVQLVLAQNEREYILKLDRGYPVLRSPGVKLLLAVIAHWLEERGLTIASTNLQKYMQRGKFYALHAGTGEPEEDPIADRL